MKKRRAFPSLRHPFVGVRLTHKRRKINLSVGLSRGKKTRRPSRRHASAFSTSDSSSRAPETRLLLDPSVARHGRPIALARLADLKTKRDELCYLQSINLFNLDRHSASGGSVFSTKSGYQGTNIF